MEKKRSIYSAIDKYTIKFASKYALLGKIEREIIETIYNNDDKLFHGNFVELGKLLDVHPANVRRSVMILKGYGIIEVNTKENSNRVISFSLADEWMQSVIEIDEVKADDN